jgi:rhodanese-related sulfurtransferase
MPARLRHLMTAALTAMLLVPIGHAMSQQPAKNSTSSSSPRTMTAAEAHAAAQSDDVVLIDIRTPEEWRETGIPAAAHAIDMYEGPKDFTDKLLQTVGGDPTRRVALIPRRRVRARVEGL